MTKNTMNQLSDIDAIYQQLTIDETPNKSNCRRPKIYQIVIGAFLVVLAIVVGLFVFLPSSKTDIQQVETTPGFSLNSHIPHLNVNTSGPFHKDISLKINPSENIISSQRGVKSKSLNNPIENNTVRDLKEPQENHWKHLPAKMIFPFHHLIDKSDNKFSDTIFHSYSAPSQTPSVRIPLYLNNNSTYYGRIYLGPEASLFNTVFDTSENKLSISTIRRGLTDCTTEHCYVSDRNIYELRAGKEKAIFGLHTSNVYFHKDRSDMIDNQIVTEDYFPSYSKIDRIDGSFGLEYSPKNDSDQAYPIEHFFRQNPQMKKIFSLWYSDKMEVLLERGELLLGNIDHSKVSGNITYVPINKAGYWTTALDNVSIKHYSITSKNAMVHFDTKSSYLVGPKMQVKLIADFFGFTETKEGLFVLETVANCKKYDVNLSVKFHLGEIVVELPAKSFLERNGDSCKILLKYHDEEIGDWIFGVPYYRTYYTVFDLENNRIGIAHRHNHM